MYLPEGLVEGRGVPGHDLGTALSAALVENLVQNRLLLEAVAIVRRLRRDDQILLLFLEKDVVGGLGQLVHRDSGRCPAMDLLQ